jgi:hypothetical protein
MPRSTLALVLALAIGSAACDSAAERSGDASPPFAPAPAVEAPAEPQSIGRGAARYDGDGASSPAAPSAPAQYAGATPAMVVRTGTASVEVDSLEPAVAAIRRLAATAGGYVGNTLLQAGDESVRSATLELRIPAGRFDEVVAGLAPLGEVDYVNISAEDVTEQYVDLEARAANARRLEGRLADLLASRTGKLDDVLAVERELARVREEIERIEGRLRYLKAGARLSTLSVSLHEPLPIVSTTGHGPIAEAFRAAWRNFVGVLTAGIASLGYLVPVLALGWSAAALGRRWRRPTPA